MKKKADGNQEEFMKDIVEWDVKNWWRAIQYWDSRNEFNNVQGKKVLDLGGRGGGLSLYWALRGAEVICSDIKEDGFEQAKNLHKKWGAEKKIRYEIIDATNIPYQNTFDIICFKSVLGGVGYNNNYSKQKQMIKSVYNALNENGKLCFCENLRASWLHQFLRKQCTKWGNSWRYLDLSEVIELTKEFDEMRFQTFGFFGVFGRKEHLTDTLGSVDSHLESCIKREHRYIVSCICKKNRNS